jgi:hypothetical protein
LTERVDTDISGAHPGDLRTGQTVICLEIIEDGAGDRGPLEIGSGIEEHHGDESPQSDSASPNILEKGIHKRFFLFN